MQNSVRQQYVPDYYRNLGFSYGVVCPGSTQGFSASKGVWEFCFCLATWDSLKKLCEVSVQGFPESLLKPFPKAPCTHIVHT